MRFQILPNDTNSDFIASGRPPTSAATSVAFTDTAERGGLLSGEVQITRASDELVLSSYVLYWGSGPRTKLNSAPIATLSKSLSKLSVQIPASTAKPQGATHLLVVTKNSAGEMATGVGAPITDSFGVPVQVTGLSGSVVLNNTRPDGTLEVLNLSANGSFNFPNPTSVGATYSVQIKTQPAEQTCALYNNNGKISAMPATNVVVRCSEFWVLPQNSASFTSIASNQVRAVFAVGETIYAATSQGLSISTNGGNTWVNNTTGYGVGLYASGTTFYRGNVGYFFVKNPLIPVR
ncbi:MAG: hypothetical protein FJY29_00025 [Betaproteobacteria bacterium]|nr:hypothetical protein [Betaproteobacteria bacterium]